MRYRNYTGWIEYDDHDEIFVGHLTGIKDIVGFHGTTVDELENAFREAEDNSLAICDETGRPAQYPCSGECLINTPDTSPKSSY